MSKLTKEAMQAALHVIKYLNQTQNKVLQIGDQQLDGNIIETYTNANWASDPNMDQKSTSGLIVKLFGSVITWNSHIQKCVTSSTVEAKYIAASATIREALFHKHLLHSLGFGDHTPIVFTNNTSCIQVVKDPAMHSKLKHVNTKYDLICNHVQVGDISTRYVKTGKNIANFLTKLVPQELLAWTQKQLGMIDMGHLSCLIGKGHS
ncbi:hypothetical protein NDA14_007471 [Ustilago hordei]|uniref:Reverse transcriptase Ty1/copia-type domain-containing protein n=1 Tax=Ustilago hordei TaxID=120017 RepID=I2G3G8_USTHO|nr:uncharacterized protein UHO2_00767 [Ustilago hordei]KAJ1037699.1 hypothetical protein NDA10_007081 [Ustilago hordei]KAJ1583097.1 hypothetical protein NDA15_000513 [Ustilago hordei]KAJ1592179.1 hypothetical protein NDA12_006218 [Ustilago hordei]KAJ1603523.1 hypothetical protein NDA14_007471 [Ustilago hordei]UTT95319.1 hypothetical protein NDA17_003177 [Ustilago hordei]